MKIVCIGGGHGLSQVLTALKDTEHQLTAIITTTDNGGSTGRLRQNTEQIAYGDIRRCISALTPNDVGISEISELRFMQENDLKGHCLGNILLSALDQHCATPCEAISQFCQMMGVQHNVYPMSNSAVDLVAEDKNGARVFGEVAVDALSSLPKSLSLSHDVNAPQQAIESILAADLVLIGPGSLLTSVMPPLLMKELKQALLATSACRIYIENLSPEDGVMAKLEMQLQANWACEVLGYHFFDLSLTPDALSFLTDSSLNNKTLTANSSAHLHDAAILRQIIDSLLGKSNIFPMSQSSLAACSNS